MEDGRLVVVVFDFCATCYTPLSFIQVALKKLRDRFCQSVEERIEHPYQQSNLAKVLLCASGSLVQYDSKPVGKDDVELLSLSD